MTLGSRSWAGRAAVLVGVAVALVAIAAVAAPAWADPVASMVKYYRVTAAYNGKPEQLPEVAQRLLGTADRSAEIFDLNAGRTQPDGGWLSDPNVLHPGWLLVLPWDAVGTGVELGPLPTGPAPEPSRPASGPTGSGGSAGTAPASTASAGTGPPPSGSVSTSTCAALPAAAAPNIPWPQLRLAPDLAWERAKGDGVMVAVVDTGVDAANPALAGKVAAGVTIGAAAAGSAPGACPDHGTAMAGIIAAQPIPGSGLVGIAPGARILPITVDAVGGTAPPAQIAAALSAAASAQANVAMVAVPVNLADPQVAGAIASAVGHNVVVVVSAATSMPAPLAGVLRVGAVTADDEPARTYPRGAVDVLAPGDAIVTLTGRGEMKGSGTDFAVPFVAGLVALVRSAWPAMSAEQVVQRVETSAERSSGTSSGDAITGWGIIDPAAAVAGAQPASAPSPNTSAGTGRRLLITGALAALLASCFLVVWSRRPISTEPAADVDPTGREEETTG